MRLCAASRAVYTVPDSNTLSPARSFLSSSSEAGTLILYSILHLTDLRLHAASRGSLY
mgnify:CR=1 FL=1